jgi:hypothetical protein
MDEHRQVGCYDPWEHETVMIDRGIAPLIRAIWDLGIRTVNSCQENQPGIMWIEFESSYDFEKFLKAAILKRDGELWESAHIRWDLTASVTDTSCEIVNDRVIYYDPPDYAVYVSARFPVEQYKELLKNVLTYSS